MPSPKNQGLIYFSKTLTLHMIITSQEIVVFFPNIPTDSLDLRRRTSSATGLSRDRGHVTQTGEGLWEVMAGVSVQ